jgi:hypothetical protein
MSAQLHRHVNKLSTVAILMQQYDPKNKRAWSLVGRIARDIRDELLGEPRTLPGRTQALLLSDIDATQRQPEPEAPARIAFDDKRQIHDMRRSGT